MVIDSSALIAILLDEAEGESFRQLILDSEVRLLGAVSRLEAGIVVESRLGRRGTDRLQKLLAKLGPDTVGFTTEHALWALDAWRRFGKGRHPAALNFGDCCTYALCKASREPLLAKGEDFSRTDVKLIQA